MQASVYLGLHGYHDDFDLSLIPDVNPGVVNVGYEKSSIVMHGEIHTLPWEKVLDSLQQYNIQISGWNLTHELKDAADWKPVNLEKTGVIGAYLSDYGSFDLRNPREDYADGRWYLKDEVIPNINKPPKALIARCFGCQIYSKEVCDFLRQQGADFEILPVHCKGEPIDSWFRIRSNYAQEILNPNCLKRDKDGQVDDHEDCYLDYLGAKNLKPFIFARDANRIKDRDRASMLAISKDVLLEFINAFKRRMPHKCLAPIFSDDSPIGKLFHQLKEAIPPLICYDPVPERKPKPRPFKVKGNLEVACSFQGTHYRFDLLETGRASGGESCHEYSFDCFLFDTGKVPEQACVAPLASWMLARLIAESDGKFKVTKSQNNDGGGYAYNFLVRDAEQKPVADFQLQGNTEGICFLGSREKTQDGAAIIQDFADLLLRDPENLAKCEIKVRDLEWKEDPDGYEPTPDRKTRNRYGWDGSAFLGADNVWDISTAGCPKPDTHLQYLQQSHKLWKENS